MSWSILCICTGGDSSETIHFLQFNKSRQALIDGLVSRDCFSDCPRELAENFSSFFFLHLMCDASICDARFLAERRWNGISLRFQKTHLSRTHTNIRYHSELGLRKRPQTLLSPSWSHAAFSICGPERKRAAVSPAGTHTHFGSTSTVEKDTVFSTNGEGTEKRSQEDKDKGGEGFAGVWKPDSNSQEPLLDRFLCL